MPYYMGDYYAQGDYYAGDPGIFGFLGKALGAAASFIPGVGPVVSKGIGAIAKQVGGGVIQNIGSKIVRTGKVAGHVAAAHPVLTAAGAAGAVGMMGAAAGRHMGMAAAGQKGMHMSKARKGHPSHLVRNRRMNVGNTRALRRSLRRAHGFARLAMRTIHLIHPKKTGRFGGFKKRRASRV